MSLRVAMGVGMLLVACGDTLRVADWPGDASAATDGGNAHDAFTDAYIDASSPPDQAGPPCAPPWLLVALSGERGRVARFALRDGSPERCADLDADGALDRTLLDVEAVSADLVVTVSPSSIQAISVGDDTLRWSVPVTYTGSADPRAAAAVFGTADDPLVVVAYGAWRGAFDRYVVVENREARDAEFDVPGGAATHGYAMARDLVGSEQLLMWSNEGLYRVDARTFAILDYVGEAGAPTITSAHVSLRSTPVVTMSQSLTLWRGAAVDDAIVSESFSPPAACPFSLTHAAPDPFRTDHAFAQCNRETVFDLSLETSSAAVLVSAAGDAAEAIHGLGLLSGD